MSDLGHSLTSSSAATRSALPSGPDIPDARRSGVGGMTSPPLLRSLLHTNCCKQVQEDEEIEKDFDFSSIKPKMKWGRWALVGWAKAQLRRAHHLLSGFVLQMVGTLSLCPPYGRWTKRQSGQALKIAAITNSCRAARTPACADAARAGAAARTGRGQPWISIPSDQ